MVNQLPDAENVADESGESELKKKILVKSCSEEMRGTAEFGESVCHTD